MASAGLLSWVEPHLSALCAACFCLHAGTHVLRGNPQETLWACVLAPLGMAVGIGTHSPLYVVIGVLWLALGTPLWLLYLVGGGELLLASVLSHLVSPVLGLWALRSLGWPAHSWWRAGVALAGLMMVTRWLTPARDNINLVFAVAEGWGPWFPRHEVYLLVLLVTALATFFVAEKLAQGFVNPWEAS